MDNEKGVEKKLEDQDWFHGMLPRKEITELLKHHGDWLVRCTEKGQETRIVISVRWKQEVKHIMLKRDRAGYKMPNKVFPNVVDLVEHYRGTQKQLNELGIKLTGKAIRRRKWMTAHIRSNHPHVRPELAYGHTLQDSKRTEEFQDRMILACFGELEFAPRRNTGPCRICPVSMFAGMEGVPLRKWAETIEDKGETGLKNEFAEMTRQMTIGSSEVFAANPRRNRYAGKAIRRRKWMIPSRDVNLDTKIGEGAFGEVYVGKLRHKDMFIPVAVKTCKQAMSTEERDEFLKEAKLMLNYRHINVVRFYGVAADKPPLMLVMENCPGGGLDSSLKKNYTEVKDKIRYCIEAARGMEYLAVKKNCVHRDLAARNCLIGFKGEIKIADFGLSRTGAYQVVDMKNTRLPIKWAAPESLEDGSFSTASDIWSFGVLMWEIFADAEIPWPGKSNKEAYIAMRSGVKMSMPENCKVPPEVKELMHECWFLSPRDRPNITYVKNDLEEIGQKYNISKRTNIGMGSSGFSSGSQEKPAPVHY